MFKIIFLMQLYTIIERNLIALCFLDLPPCEKKTNQAQDSRHSFSFSTKTSTFLRYSRSSCRQSPLRLAQRKCSGYFIAYPDSSTCSGLVCDANVNFVRSFYNSVGSCFNIHIQSLFQEIICIFERANHIILFIHSCIYGQ